MREEPEEAEEAEDKKVMTVSEEWRKKHEGRMKTVGVMVGISSVAVAEKGEEERREGEEKGEEGKRPLEKTEGKMSLGDGWGW